MQEYDEGMTFSGTQLSTLTIVEHELKQMLHILLNFSHRRRFLSFAFLFLAMFVRGPFCAQSSQRNMLLFESILQRDANGPGIKTSFPGKTLSTECQQPIVCLSVSQIDCAAKGGGSRKGKSKEENESLSEGYIIQQWIEKGVFQAIEKGYLKSLSFIVAKMDGEDGDNDDELGDVGIEVKSSFF